MSAEAQVLQRLRATLDEAHQRKLSRADHKAVTVLIDCVSRCLRLGCTDAGWFAVGALAHFLAHRETRHRQQDDAPPGEPERSVEGSNQQGEVRIPMPSKIAIATQRAPGKSGTGGRR